ncbi:MAG: DUF4384 domain-containing protein [Deltaproteobacteria bacterium]|nr:DUF4384 domain-containing protein [Deltaproteobacteria bacterium]
MLRPWEPGDPAAPDTRLRGGAFDLEVWVHDGEAARPVATGDAIRPGDRVGFRVKARADGHLLVAGVDREGHVYVCYPQGASDGSAPFAATAEPVELDQAMRFDAVPGEERLVAFFCDVPITLAEVAPRLRAESTALTMADALPRLRADCAQEEVVLRKTGAGGPR